MVQERTVKSMLTDKSLDPSWFGWRPSCLKRWGLFKNAAKLSTNGILFPRQYPFSHRCSWRRRLVVTSPYRGGGSGPEMISRFPVSSRWSIMAIKSCLRSSDRSYLRSLMPASRTSVEAEQCCALSCRAEDATSLTRAPGWQKVRPSCSATCRTMEVPTTSTEGQVCLSCLEVRRRRCWWGRAMHGGESGSEAP